MCAELARENKAPRYCYQIGYTYNKNSRGGNERSNRYIHLTKGIRVKAAKGLGGGIVKGLFGNVVHCNKHSIDVQYDNGIEYTYSYKEGELLHLEPGNVVTVHSVQGLTLPEGSVAMVDLLAPFTAEPNGGFYVAASRTKRPEDTIFICHTWSQMRDKIHTDMDVISLGLY
jgi:hypothetical protein